MIVTADTNIYISALVFQGTPLRLLHLAAQGELTLVISPHILEEIRRVLRDKFPLTAQDLREGEALIMGCAELCQTTTTVNAVKDDPSDDRVLECAIDSRSDYIVSGDRHLLRLVEYAGIKIVTVRELLSFLEPM